MDYFSNNSLSPAEATRVIREIAVCGEVLTTKHCRYESMIRRRFSFQDLLFVLRNGRIEEEPEYDGQHDQYKYRVKGITIDEDEAVAVTVIISYRSVLVVTIF